MKQKTNHSYTHYIKRLVVISVLLGTSLQPALALSTVLDFEDLVGPLARMPDSYQNLIDWEAGSNWFHYDFSQPPFYSHSGIVRISSEASDTTPSWRFLHPVVFEGAWFAGVSTATIEFRLFNAAGNLLHISPVYAPTDIPTFFATEYSGPVSRVEIHTPRPGRWVLDDLTFSEVPITQVIIDIKPGSDPNCFNNDGHGVIPVAILTTDTFDAADVDPFSVTLDGAGVRVKGNSGNAGSLEDVDSDGDLDLVLQIEDRDGMYQQGDSTAVLQGKTFSGIPIEGTDAICIVP